MTGRRGASDDYHPSKPEAIAEHPFTKLSLLPAIVLVAGLLAWFGNNLVMSMEKKLDRAYETQQSGLEKINNNVTNIALTSQRVDTVENDIEDLGVTDGKLWRAIGLKVDK